MVRKMLSNPFMKIAPLEREERLKLVNRLNEESEWNLNFCVLLSCSVIIAGLGLMQNSAAVVIGAMLVAPLMTPLIGAGLALVQGNLQLLKVSIKSLLLGTLMSILLGIIIEVMTPHWELSQEIASRAGPNILDLFIALFAGISAAYASARPNLSGALPGVAIAVALVPPITVTGIALGTLNFTVAEGAAILFLTNMVAIILGSALVFWAHGLHLSREATTGEHTGLNRIIIALSCLMFLLMLPLGFRLNAQLLKGDSRPMAYPLSVTLYQGLKARLATEEGVDYLLGGRPGADRPNDVVIWLKASVPVPESLIADLGQITKDILGEDVKPLVVSLQMAPVASDGGEKKGNPSEDDSSLNSSGK
jgi:uncharacterized hydrophobic protein (TIGR00271 family)